MILNMNHKKELQWSLWVLAVEFQFSTRDLGSKLCFEASDSVSWDLI